MDEKDIQSAFAHLLEAVADRVADQAAKRARGELSEDEFVNSVLRTVQSIAPDAELPLKPGEFVTPEPPPAPEDDDPGPDAVYAPLLDDEEDDGSGILGWILERSPRGQGGDAEDGRGSEGENDEDAPRDEPPQGPEREVASPATEPSSVAVPTDFSQKPFVAPHENQPAAPNAQGALSVEDGAPGSPVAPAHDAPGQEPRDADGPLPDDGSLWDLEDAYTGGPASEPAPEPRETAPSAFALEDASRWDAPAEAPDRTAPGPVPGSAPASAMPCAHGAAPSATATTPREDAPPCR